jgi:hypothetical protein
MLDMEKPAFKLFEKSSLKNILAIASLTLAFIAILFMHYLPKHLHRDTCVFYRLITLYAVLALSVASVSLGILGLVWLKTQKMNLKFKVMILAAIVISLWVSQRELLLPRSRSISYRMLCGHNLENLGKAILAYASINDNRFPSASQWCDLLLEHTDVSEEQFICGESFWPVFSYGFNKNLNGLRIYDVPPDTVLLFEIKGGRNVSGGPELMVDNKHDDFASAVLYVGGHTKTIKKEWTKDLKWKVPNKKPE